MPLSLTANLLGVARQCYDVKVSGAVPDSDYLKNAQGFAAGQERIDAALVGTSTDGIVLGFRGTLPPTSPNHRQAILDWMSDLDAILVPSAGFPGSVHQGFLNALDSLWGALGPTLTGLMNNPKIPVYITGHSKGGAVANLAAMRVKTVRPPDAPLFVVTFAAARPGDATFAAAYDEAIPHSARYEYQDDIVPHVPPSAAFLAMFREMPFLEETLPKMHLGYASVGDLHFIDWSDAIVGDSTLLRFERYKHLAELMAGFGFKTIIDDHSIAKGGGYDRAISGPTT